jgi:3-hydroxy acid dehydrogenase/malonic semialdehyde reductase
MATKNSIKDKLAFITGASSGIGKETAKLFAAEGARLLLCARRVERLLPLQDELLAAGASAVRCIQMDVRSLTEVETALAALEPEWQKIDILVNNAGLARGLTKVYLDETRDWEEMIDTNVKGLLYVTRAIVPGMIERGYGHVVNLGSVAGRITYANGAVYCATKAAEKSITEGLRMDVLGTPVRVTTVDAGAVETEFSSVRFRGDEARAAKVYQGITPLQAEDIADGILWAVTRPLHVNVNEILLTCIDQANSFMMSRKPV